MASSKKKSRSPKRGDNGTEHSASGVKKGTSASKSSKRGTRSKASEDRSRRATEKGTSSAKKACSKRKHASGKGAVLRVTACIVATAIVLLVALFDVRSMNSVAMQPTIGKGDVVLVWAPWFVTPDPVSGGVYLLKSEAKSEAPNFLRVIACDGREVSYREDVLRVDGAPLTRLLLTNDAIVRPVGEPEIWREGLNDAVTWHIMLPQNPVLGHVEGRIALAEGQCFTAGDNRMSSYDSRHRGAVGRDALEGRALIILKSSQSDGLVGHYLKPI